MVDYLIPRRDLNFMLFDWLDLGAREVDRETAGAVLDLAEQVAGDLFAPHYREADLVEPRLDDDGVRIHPAIVEALARYAELGLFGLSFPQALGGLGLPQAVAAGVYALFASANIATAAYPMLTTANARLIAAFGSEAQIDRFARPQIAGEWFGTMCLSEPQAGSNLADVRTRAMSDGVDALGARYRLTGNKMWISGGDQNASANIVHLVLAKVQRENGTLGEGTRGVSLFIVPKLLDDGRRNDVAVAGLNHKMGYRGTANCLLNLGEREGALGWLVGEEGQGLQQMFMMMNEARINVGLGAAALAVRGYRHAARYATERLQGRAAGTRGGDQVPIVAHVDVRRMLLQQKAYAEGALALCLFAATLTDEEGEDAQALLGLLTPMTKSWPSEFGLVANDLAIQVHGGYGYTRDFAVEQLWRDNRLNPIHEGTTGVQAIDLVGRKLLRADGRGLTELSRRIAGTTGRALAVGDIHARHAAALDAAWARLAGTIDGLREAPASAFDEATLFLRAFGHVVVAWLWLDMALHAELAEPDAFASGKLRACRFFFETELPQAVCWLHIVDARSDVAASSDPALFG